MHLALAALFGASVMAISAFYIHKRTVDQVLDRLIKLRRRCPSSATAVAADDQLFASEDDGGGSYFVSDGEIEIDRNTARSLDENVLLSSYRVSSSMPNVGLSNQWFDDDEAKCYQLMRSGNQALSNSWDKSNLIPSSLPPKDGIFILLLFYSVSIKIIWAKRTFILIIHLDIKLFVARLSVRSMSLDCGILEESNSD
ncbi:hypothetical protein CsSME_00043711 [Camellia sinensis var. sinensis]